MITRTITLVIEGKIRSGKVIMIIGPRQVGKTTLRAYLYRYILSHCEIRKSEILEKLVHGLAL